MKRCFMAFFVPISMRLAVNSKGVELAGTCDLLMSLHFVPTREFPRSMAYSRV
jgi:hypothetical protein